MSLMVSVAPPGRKIYIPEAQETVEEATERYESIANDVAYVVWDPQERPIFHGSRARVRTAMVLLAVITFESAFRKDVDYGVGKLSKGDGGKSWCLNQVNLGLGDNYGNTPYRIVVNIGGGYRFSTNQDEGWSGQDLVEDRQKCFRAALSVLRSSFRACSSLPIEHRLNQYASGHCDRGETASRIRMNLALLWMARKLPKFRDADVTNWIDEQEGTERVEEIVDLTHLPPLTNTPVITERNIGRYLAIGY